MFKGYGITNRTHSFGYYEKGEKIPIIKYPASSCYIMKKSDGSTCIVPQICLDKIEKRKEVI